MNDISFNFAPAVRTNTAVVLALAGASGSGKTKSALLLAAGLCGDNIAPGDILMIDSEGDRGRHYAPTPGEQPDFNNTFVFSHFSWRPPYTPESLKRLLDAAGQHKFKVIIVDSMSDEHEGEGGLCDMAEDAIAEQRKKGWEVNSASAWAKPKAEHKQKIVRWLRNARCHIIFCLRADEKVRFEQIVKDGKKRTVVVPIGWTPIAEKRLLHDVTTSLLFTPDQPGVPKPIKMYDKHARFFPADQKVSREAGRALAAWAAGGKLVPEEPPPDAPARAAGGPPSVAETPPLQESSFLIHGGKAKIALATIEAWRSRWLQEIPNLKPAIAEKLYDSNVVLFDEYSRSHQGAVTDVIAALQSRYR